jgi:tetratricopeptide (TPR) repeat protein
LSNIRRPGKTQYNTIAHLMLDVEIEHVEPVNRADGYRLVDSIIDLARRFIPPLDRGEEESRDVAIIVLRQIGQLLYDCGFEYEKNTLFSNGLKNKKIDCNGFSALYMAIAEELDLPLKMVRAPAHTFVRWQLNKDEYINWETTRAVEKDDQYYITTHNIAAQSIGLSSLKSLDLKKNRDEILANAFVNSGAEWLKKCRMDLALERFQDAVERDPYYEAPYFNIGLTCFHIGEIGRAITWCEAAIRLNPNHIKSHAILKYAYSELHNSVKSREHYERVLELDPSYYTEEAMEDRVRNKNTC